MIAAGGETYLLSEIWEHHKIDPWELAQMQPARQAFIRASMRKRLEREFEANDADKEFEASLVGARVRRIPKES